MKPKLSIQPYTLRFKQPAGTSRGIYTTRKVWYILLHPLKEALNSSSCKRLGGECAPLPNLSCDALPDEHYEAILREACNKWEETGTIDYDYLRPYPSILCGVETVDRHFKTENGILWDTPFSRGEAGIPINGLIWMGDHRYMLEQIENKLQTGFRCIKLKIGAIEPEQEISLLKYIRQHFSAAELELRVDANGAFSPQEAPEKLSRLAEFELHSIEQPIRAGQWEEMARLAATTPLPIALDEELIGVNEPERKKELLDRIRPQYIILKPSLHGGFSGSEEWIAEANKREIGWWITSALESNIGLNAIAQWCSTFNNPLPQGLGTGSLFTNNIEMPLEVRGDCLWMAK
ncbi:MAG: o-succinylbenzoate synthase [Tannerellaceae bacterium]|nr:o-succinylbenzoate synthase [Tannerellaceae bacterium]